MAIQSDASKAGQLLGRLGRGKPKTMSPAALAARRKGALISARNRLGRPARRHAEHANNTQNTQREHAEPFNQNTQPFVPSKRIKLTRQMVFDGSSTGNGGWNARQLAALGVSWPPRKGWLESLEGKEIEENDYWIFLTFKKKGQLNLL